MPFVIVTDESAKFGTTYYSGPVSAMRVATLSAGRQGNIPTVSDINAATRIPTLFQQQAELKAQELRESGMRARVLYDLPKFFKFVKSLTSASPAAK